MVTESERELVNEVVKCFINNSWAITPEAIWGFIETRGESVDKEKVARIMQEQQAEGSGK
jgi:hypothetical protein